MELLSNDTEQARKFIEQWKKVDFEQMVITEVDSLQISLRFRAYFQPLTQVPRKKVRQNSQEYSAYSELASIYCIIRKPLKAIMVLERALKTRVNKCPGHIYNAIGVISRKCGQYERSLQNLRKAIQFQPNNSQFYAALGQTYFWLQKYQEASINLKISLNINPQYLVALIHQGYIFILLNQRIEAISYFQKAIKFYPTYWKGYYMLAKVYVQLDSNYYKASEFLTTALSLQSRSSVIAQALADCYHEMHEFEKCIQISQRANSFHPNKLSHRCKIAASYLCLQRYQQAIQIYQNLIQQGHYKAYNGLAKVYFFVGDLQRSVQACLKSIRLYPTYNMSFCLFPYLYSQSQQSQSDLQQALNKLYKQSGKNPIVTVWFALTFRCIGLTQLSIKFFNDIFEAIKQEKFIDQIHFTKIQQPILLNQFLHAFSTFQEYCYQYLSHFNIEMGLFYSLSQNQSKACFCYQREVSTYVSSKKKSKGEKPVNHYLFFQWIFKHKITSYNSQGKSLFTLYILSQIMKQSQYHAILSIIWVLQQDSSLRNENVELFYFINDSRLKNIYSVGKMATFAAKLNSNKIPMSLLKIKFTSKQENIFMNLALSSLPFLNKLVKLAKLMQKGIKTIRLRNVILLRQKMSKLCQKIGLKVKNSNYLNSPKSLLLFEQMQTQYFQKIFVSSPSANCQAIIYSKFMSKELIKFTYNILGHYFYLDDKNIMVLEQLLLSIKADPLFDLQSLQNRLLRIFSQNLSQKSNVTLGQAENESSIQTIQAEDEFSNNSIYESSQSSFEVIRETSEIALGNSKIQPFIKIKQADYQEDISNSQLYESSQSSFEGIRNGRYTKVICKQRLAFHMRKDLTVFDHYYQLEFKNTYLILNYITKRNSMNRHIAIHDVKEDWRPIFNQHGRRRISMEAGQPISDSQCIRKKGKKLIYSWITSVAKGIQELQSMGIFHADLRFQNTILVEDIFKIIDFDYSFKVRLMVGEDENPSVYQSTVEMFKEWQKVEKNQILYHLFREGNWEIGYQQRMNQLIAEIKAHPILQDQVSQLINRLAQFSRQFHVKQYCELVGQLINQRIGDMPNPALTQSQIDQINQLLQQLLLGNLSYDAYSKQIEQIMEDKTPQEMSLNINDIYDVR